jgi:hypothetical protein
MGFVAWLGTTFFDGFDVVIRSSGFLLILIAHGRSALAAKYILDCA